MIEIASGLMMFEAIRKVVDSLAPVALIWAVLLAFAMIQGADWPNTNPHVWGTLAVMATFLLLVSTLMIRNMDGFDWLTVSLALAFAAVSLMPFYLMGAALWREWFIEHRPTILIVTCTAIIIPLGLAIIMLVQSGKNGYTRRQAEVNAGG